MKMGHKRNKRADEYVAAVVEYSPVQYDTPEKTYIENVAQYEQIIKNASHYEVDIIVFPEAGLTGVHIPHDRPSAREYLIEIPSPEEEIIPYQNNKYNEVLRRLSYTANTYKMYVAINLLEISYCSDDDPDCPDDGAYFYNTNIVFDRNGTIIARYRKFNLFCEPAFNYPKKSEQLCSFTTDFGVTFGMFICFDILFTDPSVQVVREKNVTDIVYSTAWFSEYPLLTAVAVQAAWSYSMDVNLLAANYNNPKQTGGGSGIYAGTKGPLVAFMPKDAETKLLIATVPKRNSLSTDDELQIPLEEDMLLSDINLTKRNSFILPEINSTYQNPYRYMNFWQDASFKNFTFKTLEQKSDAILTNNFEYVNNGFSCKIHITWKYEDSCAGNNMIFDPCHYKLYAYSGYRSFTCSVNHVEVCGLSLCSDAEQNFCSPFPTFDENITILSLKITAKSYNISSIPVPSTLDANMYPLDVSDFKFSSSVSNIDGRDVYLIDMNLLKPISNLVTFAIYKLPAERSCHTDNSNFSVATPLMKDDVSYPAS